MRANKRLQISLAELVLMYIKAKIRPLMANIFFEVHCKHVWSSSVTHTHGADSCIYKTILHTVTHCFFPHHSYSKHTHSLSLTVTWMDTHAPWLVSRVLNVRNHDGRRSLAEDDPERERERLMSYHFLYFNLLLQQPHAISV